jgi:hypothetical protein
LILCNSSKGVTVMMSLSDDVATCIPRAPLA